MSAEADNPKALRFYKKFGFQREGRFRKRGKRGNKCVDVIPLAKLLG